MEDELDEMLIDELDKQFPKGDPARGKALVITALAQLKINSLKEQFRRALDQKLRTSEKKWRRKNERRIICLSQFLCWLG
jgi:hypothetical protein